MKKIPDNFTPTEKTYSNLAKHGAIREFVDYELEMFIAYFTDPDLPDYKAKKQNWQMTCQRWMREAYKGQAGKSWEREREFKSINRPYTKQPADIFQLTFGDMISEGLPKPEKRQRVYHQPSFEKPFVAPMTFEQAQAELKKMKII